MEYRASDKGETIDEQALGLPTGSAIFGGRGNDTITFSNSNVDGGAGDDTFIFKGGFGAVVFWTSPVGVRVDLAKGTAQDGFGGVDALVGVANIHATGYDDVLIGSADDNWFVGLGGSDTIIGGGGVDRVGYMDARVTDATISYDAASDTFTVVKNFANGDKGTDQLTGISEINFSTGDGYSKTILKSHFLPVGGFVLTDFHYDAIPSSLDAYASQAKTGDFNGDGIGDIAVTSFVGSGTAPSPTFFLLGDGHGAYADGTVEVTGQAGLVLNGSGRTLVADFNHDGKSDLMYFNQGDDAPPFAGGTNRLFLSSPSTGLLTDASPSAFDQPWFNHAGSVGDVNGDGHLDLLVNALMDHGNDLFLNDGSGRLTLRNDLLPRRMDGAAPVYTYTQSALIDVNLDGHLDAILGHWDNDYSPATSQVLLNDGTGDFSAATPIGLPRSSISREIVLDVKAIDLNGDALPDLMLSVTNGGDTSETAYLTPHIQLLVNQGGGQFADETETRLPASVQAQFGSNGWIMSLESEDLDRDGHDDIVVTSASPSVPSMTLMNKGDGTFAIGWSLTGRVTAIDADTDGMTDLVTVNDGGEVSVSINVLLNGHIYRAGFGGDRLTGSAQADTFIGSAEQDWLDGRGGDDHFSGGGGDDRFSGGGGDDMIDAGAGLDTVDYAGLLAAYSIVRNNDATVVSDTAGTDGTDQLRNVERLHFSDASVALDIDGVAGQAYRIYQAALNRTPDAPGLGFWIHMMDDGLSLEAVAAAVMTSPEFTDAYAGLSGSSAMVDRFYQNILGRQAEAEGIAFWAGVIDSGAATLVQVLVGISESAENKAGVAETIANGFPYQPYG